MEAPTDELGVRDRLLQLAGDELLEVGDAAPPKWALPQLCLWQVQDGFGSQGLIRQLHRDVPLGQGHLSLRTDHSHASLEPATRCEGRKTNQSEPLR